ncbi:MAG: nuclear transport factor 2 family protein [Pseudomonadota bacterium]
MERHPTIERALRALEAKDAEALRPLMAEDAAFLPPTYWAEWSGPEPICAVLGHVVQVFREFRYRRILGAGDDWALEFQCKVGELDAVGVDLLTLNDAGLIRRFEVVMRPVKTVAALRDEMSARVAADARFARFKPA